MKHPHRAYLFLLVLLLSPGCAAPACETGFVPRLEGYVTDVAGVLSTSEYEQLTKMLTAYEAETHHQVAVLVVSSTCLEAIEAFSLRVANTWGIGAKGFDDGILVLLATDDRRARIELGLGMERFIPDATAQDIMDSVMVPLFRTSRYSVGLEAGLRRLMDEGRKYVIPSAQRHDDGG
jgi:uncharacterized protein